MAAESELRPAAESDLDDAYGWYEPQQTGLGEDFFASFRAALEVIKRHPELYARVRRDYRRCLLNDFPYVVYYAYSDNLVVVHAVIHTARNASVWRHRLR